MIRKDYFLDRWVIINPKRGLRPHQFKAENSNKKGTDYFAPGNENLTPPEIGRVGNPWKIRWFHNKFPAVTPDKDYNFKEKEYFKESENFGWHEIIVETPSDKQIYDLSKNHLKEVLKVYQERVKDINKKKGIKYTALFKNHGPDAGTSILHSHTQVIAYNEIPSLIKEKSERNKKECHYCNIAKIESKKERRAIENKDFVSFCPFASRFNYEIWLMPKKHLNFLEFDDKQLDSFLEIYYKIIKKMKNFHSFNILFFVYKDLHFHVEFCPRLSKMAGFEFETGTIINSVAPEDAAIYYRK